MRLSVCTTYQRAKPPASSTSRSLRVVGPHLLQAQDVGLLRAEPGETAATGGGADAVHVGGDDAEHPQMVSYGGAGHLAGSSARPGGGGGWSVAAPETG
ncbi:hypothetical protein GCM10025868_34660 [Angustibacter aerolatus]|uniref:Uncharacterized protein n=1 Tax=Angustibacter aerolatus TaxID=1162965 RepID=A0ABQ6JKX5_9ACTN|nr:hypothetical protein GCM10025868_34660 [Angustibacter aerolatus]